MLMSAYFKREERIGLLRIRPLTKNCISAAEFKTQIKGDINITAFIINVKKCVILLHVYWF